jgi:protein-disulfide reductase (glutathione)
VIARSNLAVSHITLERFGVLFLWACVSLGHAEAPARAGVPDWNDDAIDWQNYSNGLALARARALPAVLVFYADWCPTCHAYAQMFGDPSVVAASNDFVMIRVDADQAPKLNARYAFDGFYLPRVFVLGTDGEVAHDLYPRNQLFRYFIGATRPERLVALMRGMRSREI